MQHLTPAQYRDSFENRKILMKRKCKRDWVEQVKFDSFMDHIIFDEGEILGDDIQLLYNALSIPVMDPEKNRHIQEQPKQYA